MGKISKTIIKFFLKNLWEKIKNFSVKLWNKTKKIAIIAWNFTKKTAIIVWNFTKKTAKVFWEKTKKISKIVFIKTKEFLIKTFKKVKEKVKEKKQTTEQTAEQTTAQEPIQSKKQKAKKVIKKISDIIFTVFIIFMSLLIVLSVISKKAERPILKYSIMWVLTDSMAPTFTGKTYILVEKADVDSLKKGDIITFISNSDSIKGEYNTHRIDEVVIEGEEFITKGDNCLQADSQHVYRDDIVYKYVGNLNIMTFFGRIYSSVAGFVITICMIMILIVMYLVASVEKYRKDEEKNRKEQEIERLVKEEVKRLENMNKQDKT